MAQHASIWRRFSCRCHAFAATALLVAGLGTAPGALARVVGVEGTSVALTAGETYVDAPDGGVVYVWGFAAAGHNEGRIQLPGPTLIVNQGDQLSVALTNTLTEPVSLVFPGLGPVAFEGQGAGPGELATAAPPGGTATYTVMAAQPGTYTYYSGVDTALQSEMGLVGTVIVRPAGFDPGAPTAYGDASSAYEYEYLVVLTDMDAEIHAFVEQQVKGSGGLAVRPDMRKRWPVYWMVNGRAAPDTMLGNFVASLPHQPYGGMLRTRPGEKMLLRLVGAGLDPHPFHHHGNHSEMIARDGRPLSSTAGAAIDLSFKDFTHTVLPGQTYDVLWSWTGEGLGWDIYGHGPGDDCLTQYGEDCTYHGVAPPTTIPFDVQLTYGASYSGSPFLGELGTLPPGEGGMNMHGGLFYMAHSHNEREMTNYDIFPGGMMTMTIVEPPGVTIPR